MDHLYLISKFNVGIQIYTSFQSPNTYIFAYEGNTSMVWKTLVVSGGQQQGHNSLNYLKYSVSQDYRWEL